MKDGDILEYKHGYLKDANPGLYAELDIEKNKGIDISQLSATRGKESGGNVKNVDIHGKKE